MSPTTFFIALSRMSVMLANARRCGSSTLSSTASSLSEKYDMGGGSSGAWTFCHERYANSGSAGSEPSKICVMTSVKRKVEYTPIESAALWPLWFIS